MTYEIIENDQENEIKLSESQEKSLVDAIVKDFDTFNGARSSQLDDIERVKNAIYHPNSDTPSWAAQFKLPEAWELSQTLKSHLMENLYSHPEAMFDVSGADEQAQNMANRQKAMLVSYFERMKISDQIEKIVDSIVETGEATLFVGWDTVFRTIRRPQTFEESVIAPTDDGFVIEQKTVFDGPRVKFVPSVDFVYDTERKSSLDKAKKIYRTYATVHDLSSDKLNTLLTSDKIQRLSELVSKNTSSQNAKSQPAKGKQGIKGDQLEILEFWGDIELEDGKLLPNRLIVIAGRSEIIRFESNPFITNPFVHASVIEDPSTFRGVSPLKVALGISELSSTILNKQLDALSLIVNPPYLAPKGCFKGEQEVKPGKIIEYDAALMPNQPVPLHFESALHGWDFITFFKASIESATGIYKTMSGDLQSEARTATEVNYAASGQSARLNNIIDSINRKIIIPAVEKTAEIVSNFKLGTEIVPVMVGGSTVFIEICDDTRNADYIYRYGDRKAFFERKYRFKELFEIISSFANINGFAQKIDWTECFKFALEQYGVENSANFLAKNELN